MTQVQMARALSINYNTYIAYEYGHRSPSKFAKKHIEDVTRGLLNRPVAKVSKLLTKEDKDDNNNKKIRSMEW